MDTARAKSGLAGTRFARLEWVAETGSTNSDLLDRARRGDSEQVLVAGHQRAGRGRLGRVWQAPPGASLLCSVLVRPRLGPAEVGAVTTALGLAAAAACETVAGVSPGLKWPNDLVAVGAGPDGSDLKLSGILAESVVVGGTVEAVVAGIGINVNWPDDLPADLAATATSLRHLTATEVDLTGLLVAMLVGFGSRLDLVEGGDTGALAAEYLERSATIGRRVRVELPRGELVGIATALTAGGGLTVLDDDEVAHEVVVGDVVHLRPLDR